VVTSSNPNQHRQITLDYGVFATETSSVADKNSVDANDDLQRATRVPTGFSSQKTFFSASLTFYAQCHKTFYCRNLQIFIIN
jgi:hypothetical protein